MRGVAAVHRASRFGRTPDYLSQANAEACTIVQLETPEAIERLPEIAAVPGVDALFLGPGDLRPPWAMSATSPMPRCRR